jgi:hypothetical protein
LKLLNPSGKGENQMLISRKKRFLFVHIQKTAGVSLERVLKEKIPDTKRFLGRHDHASWGREFLGPDWDEYYKFAFVRNPWDRMVSWYSMIRESARKERWYQRVLKMGQYNHFWKYVTENSNTFEEFLYNCTGFIDDFDGRKSIMYDQLDYLTDEKGKVIVDFIGRNENLAQDAAVVFQKLGLEGVRIPYANKSTHDHYSIYYTEETRDLVEKRHARDIEFFGYKFEEKHEINSSKRKIFASAKSEGLEISHGR